MPTFTFDDLLLWSETLGLFHEYQVVYQPPSWGAAPSRSAP